MKKVIGFTWTVEDSNLITHQEIYGDVLVDIGRRDKRLVCLTADLGNTTKIGRFKAAFPERFINVGVAEQNMVAIASGLAATGLKPVISTYATFASLRAAEFIRTDLAYNQRAVIIIGTLAGVSFGQGGPTHHTIEDLALMRAIPGMVVLAPCDGYETARAVMAAYELDDPVYIRIGRGMEPPVHRDLDFDFVIGRASVLRQGEDLTVIACGPSVWQALSAAERVAAKGIEVRVLNMHSLKPLDEEAILAAARETRRIITVEDHNVINGLGSAVADVVAGAGLAIGLRKLGHHDRFAGMGIPEDLAHEAGIDDDGIAAAIAELARCEIDPDDDWQDAF